MFPKACFNLDSMIFDGNLPIFKKVSKIESTVQNLTKDLNFMELKRWKVVFAYQVISDIRMAAVSGTKSGVQFFSGKTTETAPKTNSTLIVNMMLGLYLKYMGTKII